MEEMAGSNSVCCLNMKIQLLETEKKMLTSTIMII